MYTLLQWIPILHMYIVHTLRLNKVLHTLSNKLLSDTWKLPCCHALQLVARFRNTFYFSNGSLLWLTLEDLLLLMIYNPQSVLYQAPLSLSQTANLEFSQTISLNFVFSVAVPSTNNNNWKHSIITLWRIPYHWLCIT